MTFLVCAGRASQEQVEINSEVEEDAVPACRDLSNDLSNDLSESGDEEPMLLEESQGGALMNHHHHTIHSGDGNERRHGDVTGRGGGGGTIRNRDEIDRSWTPVLSSGQTSLPNAGVRSDIMRAFKLYVNVSHAWFLNYAFYAPKVGHTRWLRPTCPQVGRDYLCISAAAVTAESKIDIENASDTCQIVAVLEPGTLVRCIGTTHVAEPYGVSRGGATTIGKSTTDRDGGGSNIHDNDGGGGSISSGGKEHDPAGRRHRLQCMQGWVSTVSTDGKRLLVDAEQAANAAAIGYV